MSVNTHHATRWFTTPAELRRVADEMERRWPKLRPGQSTVVHVASGPQQMFEVCIDQERIAAEQGEP